MRERIALVTTPGAYWGAEEAGISVVAVRDPSRLAASVRQILAGGEHALIAVSEEAAAGQERDLAALMEQAPPEVSIVLVPAPGARTVEGLGRLRERFAAALGVDVWKTAALKAGADV